MRQHHHVWDVIALGVESCRKCQMLQVDRRAALERKTRQMKEAPMTTDRNYAAEYRDRKQREDQSKEIIRELEERAMTTDTKAVERRLAEEFAADFTPGQRQSLVDTVEEAFAWLQARSIPASLSPSRPVMDICPDCSGAGGDNQHTTCGTCNGSGGVPSRPVGVEELREDAEWLRSLAKIANFPTTIDRLNAIAGRLEALAVRGGEDD